MSSVRTLLCGFLGALLSGVLVTGLSAQDLLNTIGPLEKKANPITPENPIPRRTFSVAAIYPADARGIDATGMVSLVATIDETGRVAEIRKAREPLVMSTSTTPSNPTALRIAADAFVREAASALRRWTYDPPAKGPIASGVVLVQAGRRYHVHAERDGDTTRLVATLSNISHRTGARLERRNRSALAARSRRRRRFRRSNRFIRPKRRPPASKAS